MGRKRQRQQQPQPVRPEHTGAAEALYAADNERYHGQNGGLQRDMAQLGAALLGLQGAASVLADLGCGSGLSADVLNSLPGVAWVGTDITKEMLQLAGRQPGSAGHLALSDFGQGLPFREACLDGAISVSAVQWLCTAADPPASILRFFSGLHSSLRPGARAALQVYPEDDAQMQQLLAGAWQCGLDAGFFVALPHPTPARKCYLLLQRPAASPPQHLSQPAVGACLSPRACNLAFPKTGSCILSWMRHMRQQGVPVEGLAEAASRVQQEHAGIGKRMVVWLLRRALSLSEGSTGTGRCGSGKGGTPAQPLVAAAAAGGEGVDSGSGGGGGALVLRAEVQASEEGLMPCGGCIYVQLTATAGVLQASQIHSCSTTVTPLGQQQQQGGGQAAAQQMTAAAHAAQPTAVDVSAAEGAAEGAAGIGAAAGGEAAADFDPTQFQAAAEAAARQLLGGARASDSVPTAAGSGSGSSGGCHVQRVLVKPASGEEAALHARQRPVQAFSAPPEGSSASRAHRHARLEPLQVPGLAAAVLHAHNMAQHLVLRFSSCGCSNSGDSGSCCHECSSTGDGGGGSSSSSERCTVCVARSVRALCAELNGCVVGVDAHLFPGRVDATWVLFVQGLQHADRAELAAAVLRHCGTAGTASP